MNDLILAILNFLSIMYSALGTYKCSIRQGDDKGKQTEGGERRMVKRKFVKQIACKLVGAIVALVNNAFIGLSTGGGLVVGIYLATKLIEIWF